jgi:membrane protein YqaA with SNARE-associated domain
MSLISLTNALPQLVGVFSGTDDTLIAALAMLLGVVGGWYLGNFSEQLRAKRTVLRRRVLQQRRPPR